ncbi:MAG: proline dehydrogenase family protein [Acidobacteria bacterium]|nr:proline dehydrogenase family protein [Acidobacteriota bacterium]
MYPRPKALFFALSRSATLTRFASQHGPGTPDSLAGRFVAGETVEAAIDMSRRLQSQGRLVTLDHLDKRVTTLDESTAATTEYIRLIDVIMRAGIERNISLKLTQLGLDVDRATCLDNLRRILEPAARQGFFIRINMEHSPYIEQTIDIFETLWHYEYRNVGVALQSYLHRTEADLRRMNELGARVRLVKGAYKEPSSAALRHKDDRDRAFVRQAHLLLDSGTYPAIATHDPNIIEQVRTYADARGLAKDRWEFQMLYGIRHDLQASLVSAGYRVRVYVPFGSGWFPYFMRRMGERPLNVGLALKPRAYARGSINVRA